VANGALRGLNDTRVPMLFAALSFWLVGFTCCYALAFHAGYGVAGIWAGFTIGLLLYAVLLVWRFAVLTRRGVLPAAPHAPSPH
jgi:MATE family multidrug resistance protein